MARSKKIFTCIIFSHILSSLLAFLDASSHTLQQGDMLNSSSSTFLVSSRKNFTLGFFKPSKYSDNNNTYLGIWYTNSADQRAVWVANRNSPIYNNSGVLSIDKAGKLIITYNGGSSAELYASKAGTINITATLLDSGNFVVREANSNGSTKQRVLWQSFDYPTHTLLPEMKLGVNHRTGRIWSLTSWFAEDEPALGAFTLEWDPSGRRLVVRRRGMIYWTSGVLKDKAFEFLPKPDTINWNYNFINVTDPEEEYFTYSLIIDPVVTPEDRKSISGWVLEHNGFISGYQDRHGIARVDLCYGYNTRGSELAYSGCELWEQPKCRNRHQKFDLRSGYFIPSEASPDKNESLGLSDCRDICWIDCDCVGFNDYGTGCVFWKGNLVFHQDYIGDKVRQYVLISNSNAGEKKWIWIVIAVVVALLMLLFGLLCFLRRKSKRRGRGTSLTNNRFVCHIVMFHLNLYYFYGMTSLVLYFIKIENKEEKVLLELMTSNGDEPELDGNKGHELKVFSFACMMDATSSFSSECKLGEGGFGPVYKGKLREGHEIAVKRLSRISRRSGQGLLEFKNELILIAKLQHMNLVRLLGCCIQGDEKMLVYEYMPNKSLDSLLFDTSKNEQLTWERRLNIIEGIAQGLLYLHKYSRLKIIHRDLKASNILLDENMIPKISDFGMARICKQNVSEANTNRIGGTYGYMAPECMEGVFSVKSDVYSFGVLMLEIVSGRKNNSFYDIEGPLNLVGFAWKLWNKNATLELVDPTLGSSCIEQQFLRCIHVGLLCVEDRAVDRPTMPKVVSMLTNDSMALPVPKKPAFVSGSRVVEEDSHRSKPEKYSVNGLSISAIDAR
ncbi:G-type lectin S-receptor-like serine/threonine-protein kinase At1g67520 [Cornus florida]|uniref:G-type lectin S-receptor-like serine/threonine-protein kinase At1g67520 n=1 Tax=Cornus florida TaxID=4283 RepID=UPI00289BE8D3|nr:G-type lectin S-receptor-like serine/threonine-protein kinase At1g67520 [Cornus florida]